MLILASPGWPQATKLLFPKALTACLRSADLDIRVPMNGSTKSKTPPRHLRIDPPARDVGGTSEGNHKIGEP